jgi:hypothetical protein
MHVWKDFLDSIILLVPPERERELSCFSLSLSLSGCWEKEKKGERERLLAVCSLMKTREVPPMKRLSSLLLCVCAPARLAASWRDEGIGLYSLLFCLSDSQLSTGTATPGRPADTQQLAFIFGRDSVLGPRMASKSDLSSFDFNRTARRQQKNFDKRWEMGETKAVVSQTCCCWEEEQIDTGRLWLSDERGDYT